MLVLTLFFLLGPEQGLTLSQIPEAGFVFSQTDRFYPAQLPGPYLLAEKWHRQPLVYWSVQLSLEQEHL
jgi:hypothetical protein